MTSVFLVPSSDATYSKSAAGDEEEAGPAALNRDFRADSRGGGPDVGGCWYRSAVHQSHLPAGWPHPTGVVPVLSQQVRGAPRAGPATDAAPERVDSALDHRGCSRRIGAGV